MVKIIQKLSQVCTNECQRRKTTGNYCPFKGIKSRHFCNIMNWDQLIDTLDIDSEAEWSY